MSACLLENKHKPKSQRIQEARERYNERSLNRPRQVYLSKSMTWVKY